MRKRNLIRAILLPLLLALPPGPAAAQTAMPDPLTGVTDHYWADPDRPVQTELRDCHLFEVLGWGRGLDETRSRMRMACHHLARMGAGGSDADRATISALLAFEAEARAQMVDIDRSMRAGAAPDAAPPVRQPGDPDRLVGGRLHAGPADRDARVRPHHGDDI